MWSPSYNQNQSLGQVMKLICESVGWILSVTIQMKTAKQCFHGGQFIMLYKVVQTFETVDEILKCDHSNESYWAVLYCDTVCYPVQGGSNFWI